MLRHMCPPTTGPKTTSCATTGNRRRLARWRRRSRTVTSQLSWGSSATSLPTSAESESSWRKTMGKKRKSGNLTPEDHARHERLMEMVRERIAYHEAKAREEEEAAEHKRSA